MTDPRLPVVVVGAGPAGLAVAVALVRDGLPVTDLVVLDRDGDWLVRWDAQLAKQRVTHLRSGWVFSPDPDPTALRRWVSNRGGIDHNNDRTPPVELFDRFCRDVIRRTGLHGAVTAASVSAIDVAEGAAVVVRCDDGTDVRARAVVVAVGSEPTPAHPVIDAHASSRTPRPDLVGALDVDLRDGGELATAIAGRRVTIVGGGSTAGHLAVAATDLGADVTLSTRSGLRRQPADVHERWFEARRRLPFRADEPWDVRSDVIERARRGSMPPALVTALDERTNAGNLTRRVGEITGADDPGEADAPNAMRLHDDAGSWVADTVWLATGQRPATQQGLAVELVGDDVPERLGGHLTIADDLRWGAHPVWFTGASASLAIGPLAGNLAGARTAARVIAEQILAG